jgi:vacuolar-type H+-ATPase subunit I/STV1
VAAGLDRLVRILVGLLGAIVAFMVLVAIVGGPWAFSSGLVMGGLILAFGLPGALVAAFVLVRRDNLPRRIRVAVTATLCAGSVGLLAWTLERAGDPGPYPFDARPLIILMAFVGGIGGLIGELAMRPKSDA